MTTETRSSPSGPEVIVPDPALQSYRPQGVCYVDLRERLTPIPAEEQNGSAGLPFSTFTAAVAAITDPVELLSDFAFILYNPPDASSPTLDLSKFLAVTLMGVAPVRSTSSNRIIIADDGDLAELHLHNVSAQDANIVTGDIVCTGSGNHLNLTARSFYIAGDQGQNGAGNHPSQLQLENTVSELSVTADNAFLDGITTRALALTHSRITGDITLTFAGATTHQLIGMGRNLAPPVFIGDALNVFNIDGWTNEPSVSMGPVPLAAFTVNVF